MLAGLVLAGVVLCAAAAGRWGRPWSVPLAVASIGWLLVNKSMEGRTLWVVARGHGLTAADLAGLAGLLLAAAVALIPERSDVRARDDRRDDYVE